MKSFVSISTPKGRANQTAINERRRMYAASADVGSTMPSAGVAEPILEFEDFQPGHFLLLAN
jgi:hypothetical protein